MKNIQILLFLLLFWGSNSRTTFASHIVGGEINYQCLGNNQYEISIIVYRDSVNGNIGALFDDPLSMGIFDAVSGTYLRTEYFNFTNHTTIQIPPYLGNIALMSNIGFQRAEYKKTIILPYRAGGYQLTYQRCCRNNIISNIMNPSSTGFTMTTVITATALLSCNSSPMPIQDVPLFLCVWDTFEIDMSAIDAQGDSLSYGFYTPFNGADFGNPMPDPPMGPPYSPFNWQTPYSQNNQVPGIYIDSITGMLTGCRGTVGYFAMGLYINEYRNGQLLSTTYRDFSLTLVPCTQLSQVGVNQIATPLQANISPNPVTNFLNIQLEKDAEATLRLYSSLGQELMTVSFLKNTEIDMSQLPQGIYLLDLTSGKERVVQKIVKQ